MTTSSRSKAGPSRCWRERGALRHDLALAVAAGAVLGLLMQLPPPASLELGMVQAHGAAAAQAPAAASAASGAQVADQPSASCPGKGATRNRNCMTSVAAFDQGNCT